jgi:hypothetical protein
MCYDTVIAINYPQVAKPKVPTNYLIKELPDFDRISSLFFALHKKPITFPEARQFQKLWNKIEPDEPEYIPKSLF